MTKTWNREAPRTPVRTGYATHRVLPYACALLLIASGLVGQTSPSSSSLSGIVIDHTTERPVPGATIELIGEDLSVLRTVTADSNGAFTLQVPGSGLFALRAHAEGYRSQQGLPFDSRSGEEGTVEARLSTEAILLDPITLAFASDTEESSDVELGTDDAGSSRVGTIRGTSTDAGSSEPLDQVRIELLDRSDEVVESTVTNGTGGFFLRAPGEGTYRVRASRLGFATRTSDEFVFRDNRWAIVNLPMSAEAIDLDPIRVAVRAEGPRYPHMTEYYDRRDHYERLGQGKFIERLELEAFEGSSLVDALPALSSVVQPGFVNGSGRVLRMRARGIGGGLCRPNIYIDGVLQRALIPTASANGDTVGMEGSIDQILTTSRVESVEIYDDGFLNAPGEFSDFDFRMQPGQDGAGCGVIAIWTRRN